MSKFTSILLAPYHFFFGENGIFSSLMLQRGNESSQALYFGIPALVFAIVGLLFLIVGELSAGKPLIKKYEDRVEEISKEESKLKGELSQELQIARASNKKFEVNTVEISKLRNRLAELLESKKILLSKLHSLAPEQPKYQYQLAGTFFTRSELKLISPATTKEEVRIRQEISNNLKEQGLSIMKQIAPEDKPGYLEAHLYLAKDAAPKGVEPPREQAERLRLVNTHLNHALVRDDKNTSALSLKVLVAQKFGQNDETKTYLTKLFETDPYVYPQLCQLNGKLGVADENIGVLNGASVRLSGRLARMTGSSDRRTKCATYLVDCLYRLEKNDEADKIINDEIGKFPDDQNVQLWGKRLMAIGQEIRYRSADPINSENSMELIGYLRTGYELDPANQKILNHIVRLRRSEVPGIAKISEEIYQPSEKAPASVENILGTQALGQKDYLEAAKRITRATQKDPLNAEYLNNLAYVYLIRPDSDPQEALKLIDRAIIRARSANIRVEYLTHFYDTKGKCLLALGKLAEENGDTAVATSQYAAATAQLLKAMISRPNDLSITKALVECYKSNRQPELVEVWSERVKQLEAAKNN